MNWLISVFMIFAVIDVLVTTAISCRFFIQLQIVDSLVY